MRFSYLEIVIPELSVFANKLFLCFETALIGDQPTMLSLNSPIWVLLTLMSVAWTNQSELKASASHATSTPVYAPPLRCCFDAPLLLQLDWSVAAAADDRASRLRGWRARSQLHSLFNTAPLHKDGRQCLPRPRAAAGFPEKAQRSVRRVRRGRRRIYPRWALRGSRSTVRPRRWSKNLSLY